MTAVHQASPLDRPSRHPLRILHLEDSEADSAAVRRYLERQGFGGHIVWVDSRADFLEHLAHDFDLILADHSMPGFDSCEALRLVQERCPQVPFIIVSGTITEEAAVESIKSGASDYIWKDRLQRLGPAIETALRERQHEAELSRSRESLAQNQTRLKAIFDGSLDAVLLADDAGRYVDANPAAAALLGYSREELLRLSVPDVLSPGMRPGFDERWASLRVRGEVGGEFALYRKDGTAVEVEQRATFNVLPGLHLTIVRDVTERKRAEVALAEAAHRNAEILESIDDGFFALDADWRFTYVNARTARYWQREPEDLIGKEIWTEFPAIVGSAFEAHYRRAAETGRPEEFDAYYPPLQAHRAVRVFPFAEGLSVYFRDVTEEKLAEAALRESEHQYAQIADAMPQIMWTTDSAGYHDYFNEQWYVYTGMARPAEQDGPVREFDWNDYLHADDVAHTLARWAHSLATGEPYEIEYRFRRAADGAYRWFIGRAVPVRDEAGAVVRWFGTCTDIHDLRDAREEVQTSEERLRLVGQATNDSVWDWDVGSRAVVMNEAFTDVFGWAEPADGGFTIDWMLAHVHPDEQGRVFEVLLDTFKGRGQRWEDEYRFERADGTWADVITRGHIVRSADGRAVRIVGTMLDRTARKATERALVEAKEAADEAREAAEKAREAAEEVARAKSSLLMNMSHEIRTPLTAVIGYAELLGDECGPEQTVQREYAAIIERGGRRLLDTLNSVLDLAQIEAGALPLRPVDVDLLAEAGAAIAALQPLGQAKGLALTCTGPPTAARADRPALARVLTNLVGNAIKFTDRGIVAVDVWSEGGSAWARVTDTGVGIAPEFLPYVFEDFKQESSGANRSHEGSGLGLAITRGLVTRMGGEITASSEKGGGSTFTVCLPAA